MKNYLASFFKRYDYPEDSSIKLLEAYTVLENNDDFTALLKLFYDVDELHPIDIEHALDKVSADSGVHAYTVKFLYYVCLTKELPKLYKNKGLDESVMWDSLEDFKYKLNESLEVYGIPGFFSTSWFYSFLRARLFKLGRMQYHIIPYKGPDMPLGDTVLKSGDNIINIHIPSSGESFNKDARYASYDKAYHFFKDVIGTEVKMFICHSWLLFPKNREILGEKSNIVSFLDDFAIAEEGIYNTQRDNMWRIFGKAGNDAPINELPRDSSLRRAYADYLAAGNNPGWAKGIFMWDDVNKCPIVK